MTDEERWAATAEAAVEQQVERHRARIITIINRLGPVLDGERPLDACAALASMVSLLLHKVFPEPETEIEVVIGADHVMRLNIDGLCALRVGITTKGCVLRIRNDARTCPCITCPYTCHR